MKPALWLLSAYALALTGIAAYEYARIDHLLWVITYLLAGTPN
jgi:hypothetical protein